MSTNRQLPLTLPVSNILRHRLTTDGAGVITLVGSCGCPLHCRYCINADSIRNPEKATDYTPEMLYEKLKIDDLYFQATGGGVTFGGGEPLLYADFIHAFRKICPPAWRLNLETSLNIEESQLKKVLDDVDDYIVDIKDMNPEIYEKYTGSSSSLTLHNLDLIIKHGKQDRLRIRVPSIPDFNTQSDVQNSVRQLTQMGFQRIETFSYIRKDH